MAKTELNKTHDALLALLRSALWGSEPDRSLFEGLDAGGWAAIMGEAAKQAIMPLIFDVAIKLPQELLPPRDIRMKALAYVSQVENHNARVKDVLAEVSAMYRQSDIDFVLLKGLAAASSYPDPDLRTEGDIDIFFPNGGAERAQQMLNETYGQDPDESSDVRHYKYYYKGVEIENHFNLVNNRHSFYLEFERELISILATNGYRELSVGGESIPIPDPNFHLLFMLEHAAFHLLDGLGFRQLCDIARHMWYCRNEIDKEVVLTAIDKFKLSRIANIFTIIFIDYLGMPEDVSLVAPDRSATAQKDVAYVMSRILSEGNFGVYNKNFFARNRKNRNHATRSIVFNHIHMISRRRAYRIINPSLFRWKTHEKICRLFRQIWHKAP